MAEHVLDPSKVHYKWDNSLAPHIEIESGDVVHCQTREVTNDQVTPGCDASVLSNLDFDQLYPLAGPNFV
jgi:acetamidase/formamidase